MGVFPWVAWYAFRRHSAYPLAGAAEALTNTAFGFIRASILLALWNARPGLGGYEAADAGHFLLPHPGADRAGAGVRRAGGSARRARCIEPPPSPGTVEVRIRGREEDLAAFIAALRELHGVEVWHRVNKAYADDNGATFRRYLTADLREDR